MGGQPKNKKTTSTKIDWLDAGLNLLRDQGQSGLTVESLCRAMGRTKGSFYHHFEDHRDFAGQVLAHWETRFTSDVISTVDGQKDALRRIEVLFEESEKVDFRLESRIRAWADQDELARMTLNKVDERRIDYAIAIFTAIPEAVEKANVLGQLGHACFVGAQMLYPHASKNEKKILSKASLQSLLALAGVSYPKQ